MSHRRLPTINYVLKDLDYDDLRNIASTLRIKGRSKMKINELRKALSEKLKNENFVVGILKNLNENALSILDIIRDYDGVVGKKKALQEFGRSQSTFRKYAKILEDYGLLYFNYEKDSYFIPKEILRFINDFVVEKEEKMDFGDFLDYYVGVEQLRNILREFELPTKGKKSNLIERILKSKIPEKEILQKLSVYDLKWIAEDMGLKKTGRKDEIINRLLDQIQVSKIKEFKVTGEKVSPLGKKRSRKGIDALVEEIVEAIDRDFHPRKPVSARLKERQIEDSLKAFLEGRFKDHKIEMEKTKSKSRIDLSVDGKIGIELKYSTYNNVIDPDKVAGQVERYLNEFSKVILVLCLQGYNERLIKKANSAKSRCESKGARVVIKII